MSQDGDTFSRKGSFLTEKHKAGPGKTTHAGQVLTEGQKQSGGRSRIKKGLLSDRLPPLSMIASSNNISPRNESDQHVKAQKGSFHTWISQSERHNSRRDNKKLAQVSPQADLAKAQVESYVTLGPPLSNKSK